MKTKKKCYICLPITGFEDTVFKRVEEAKADIEKMGLIPVSPLEYNEQTPDNIDFHTSKLGSYMGRDVKCLIDDCDCIFYCKGYQNSKGCNVEREVAKQYGKVELYQEIPMSMTIKEGINQVLLQYYMMISHAKEVYGDNSPEAMRYVELANNKTLQRYLEYFISPFEV